MHPTDNTPFIIMIFLDRISRPGEFDDEQQFLREEEEALADMDDMQRAEYHRAKGTCVGT